MRNVAFSGSLQKNAILNPIQNMVSFLMRCRRGGKGGKTAAAGTDVLWELCVEATRVKGNVRQLSLSCVSPSEPQTSHEPLRARGGSEQDFPHSIQLPLAPKFKGFFASVKRETKDPAREAVNICLCLHQAWSRVCQNRMCAGGICQRTTKASLPHTLKAKTSASLFFQFHLFIEYFISLLISVSGKDLCGDLSLLSCKVFTLLLLVLWTS